MCSWAGRGLQELLLLLLLGQVHSQWRCSSRTCLTACRLLQASCIMPVGRSAATAWTWQDLLRAVWVSLG